MLHGGPEVHGDGAELDLHGIVFHCIHVIDRYADNEMVASVAVRFRRCYVILLLDQDQVGLLFERVTEAADILFKEADDADSGNVLEQSFCVADTAV